MAELDEFGDALDGVAQIPLQSLLNGFTTIANDSRIVLACATFIFLVLATRLVSGKNENGASPDGKPRKAPSVPYWIPVIGHIPNMAINADGFVKSLRTKYSQGIFALNFGGTRHNILYSPGLTTALLGQKHIHADSDKVARGMMQNVFGFPKREMSKYDAALPDILSCYKHITTEPGLGNMVNVTANKIKQTIKDLVTENDSVVDQMPWERISDIRITTNKTGKQVVEASLLPLIRDYAAQTSNQSLMGSDFLANFPEFFDDIWSLDRGFLFLATGLPRWFPIPALTRAHIARRRILENIRVYHEALEKEANGQDPGPKWTGLDDVGQLVKSRVELYRKYDFSISARAAVENSLMWASNANSDMLIFWMVNRIYADKALLEMIREEIARYAKVIEPKQEFNSSFKEPARLETFDIDGLCNNCPLLKSCYVECLRLDTAPWSLKIVQQDFVLQSREKGSTGWQLRKGDYVHAAHDLHNTDPNYFKDPMIFKADRHIKEEGDEKKRTADLGSIRPYGGGSSMCKGRAFAFKQSMMFTAAIVSMYDIDAAGGGPWKMPAHKKATGVYSTTDTTRVWIKRREVDSTDS